MNVAVRSVKYYVPFDQVGWLLLAVLLYHQPGAALWLWRQLNDELVVEEGGGDAGWSYGGIDPLFKAVQQCKWRLFQQRQVVHDQSHKEMCAPVIDKCR